MESLKKKRVYLFSVIVVITAIVIAARPSDSWKESQTRKDAKAQPQVENYAGPIVDYDNGNKISSLSAPDLRKSKNRLHNNLAPQPLGEMASDGYDIHTHWNIGLPAFPVSQSQVIVIGEVADAEAFVSEDRTGVYSEFSIRIIDILKNKTAFPLTVGGLMVTEREGGVVRLQSGSLFPVRINDQGMPRIDRRYLLFLKHDSEQKAYHIVTGYELNSDKVVPLDAGNQFNAYRSRDVHAFLNSVQETVAQER